MRNFDRVIDTFSHNQQLTGSQIPSSHYRFCSSTHFHQNRNVLAEKTASLSRGNDCWWRQGCLSPMINITAQKALPKVFPQSAQQSAIPFGFTHTGHCHSSERKLPGRLVDMQVKPQRQQSFSLRWNSWRTAKERIRNFAGLQSRLLFTLPPPRTRFGTINLLDHRNVSQEATLLAPRTKAQGPINHSFANPRNVLSSFSSRLQAGYWAVGCPSDLGRFLL